MSKMGFTTVTAVYSSTCVDSLSSIEFGMMYLKKIGGSTRKMKNDSCQGSPSSFRETNPLLQQLRSGYFWPVWPMEHGCLSAVAGGCRMMGPPIGYNFRSQS